MNEENLVPVPDASAASRAQQEIYDWMQTIVITLVCIIPIFVFIACSIDVIGYSMLPTLENGDKIVITRLASSYDRGDIVVLRKDTFRDEPIVKRVIAVGGQTVDIDFTEGVVYIDGEPVDEPYVNELTFEREDFAGPITVPEGCVFVMGDNRNLSADSRHAKIGCVDTRYIMGKVIFRILPLSKFGAISGWEY